ncbi:MAG: hypothetical protein H0X29_09090 [Parachlamydiaceae bacterium]|nr:hypothetical protein [Parachlamydiaceae bacterium]
MKKGHSLYFKCLSCQSPIHFSIFDLDHSSSIDCASCSKKYAFTDPILMRQIKKFEALCCKIHDAEEILGNAFVGVDVGSHHVKVPYKLLLTRLSSSLELMMNGQTISIAFRIEPIQDQQFTSAL